MKLINQVLTDYKLSVQPIEISDLTKLKNIKAGIDLSVEAMKELRKLSQLEDSFPNQEDEIDFFKNIKPFVLGRLKFFGQIQKFELNWPKANVKSQKKYIRSSLNSLDDFRANNITFWHYIKNKETRKDSFYFLRCNYQVGIDGDMSQFIVDPEFYTSYDILKARFVAADLLTRHYKKLLSKLPNKGSPVNSNLTLTKSLTWNGSKTDLVELIHALHAAGALINGQSEIAKTIQCCETFFNINLGNTYKTFAEIKTRKNDQTKFIDSLKQGLLKKINTDDSESI